VLELITICQSLKVRLGRILVKQKNFTFPGWEMVSFPLFSFSHTLNSFPSSLIAIKSIFTGVSSDTALLINAISSEVISGGIVGVAVGVLVCVGVGVNVGIGVIVGVSVGVGVIVGVGIYSKSVTQTIIVALLTIGFPKMTSVALPTM